MTIYTPSVAAPLATRIRAFFDGKLIADSRRVILFRESPMKIHYFFPEKDIVDGFIDAASAVIQKRKNGAATIWTVRSGSREAEGAAFAYTEPTEGAPDLRAYIALDFAKMERWLEEDEELIGHPRDPYTRIDVRKSSRRVRVEETASGTVLAETDRPLVLTETGLGIRYYIPKADVVWDLMEPTDTVTVCPYKGRAAYWRARIGETKLEDIAWGYPEPLQDAVPIRDTVSFYHEKKTIRIYVDGELEESPPQHFSK
jgi:uncharacterized protein (DUF427 family)